MSVYPAGPVTRLIPSFLIPLKPLLDKQLFIKPLKHELYCLNKNVTNVIYCHILSRKVGNIVRIFFITDGDIHDQFSDQSSGIPTLGAGL